MSNPDWPGPYWQDDASAGRRGGRDDLPQNQSPWEDAGFWRADDRRPARPEDWQPAREREPRRPRGQAAGAAGREDRRDSRGRPNASQNDRASRSNDAGRYDDGGRPRADRNSADRSGAGDRAGERSSRRASRGYDGSGQGAPNGAGRFSQTADDLKNRLGMRGSAVRRDRSRNGDQPAEEDFWGESQRSRPEQPATSGPGRRGRPAAGPVGDDGQTQGWQEPGTGSGGYRGTRRASGSRAAYDEDGTGQWSARTALRDRTARIQEGVRSRTATFQRGGGRGGRGGGDGWDGGAGQPGGAPLNRRQRFKRYLRSGDWWRHWTWKKVFGLIGGGIASLVLLGALAIFIIYEKTPIPSAAQADANWQSSQVYFSGGKQLLGTFDDTVNGVNVNRILLQPNQIPAVMDHAMTAAEDRGFYSEGGISVTGLLRSAYDDLFGSGGLQGGSTITMQYAKNYYSGVNTGQNATTKIKEIFIAMKLAHRESKQWIMTQYLNTVPFGPTTYGVAAGAEEYFNINLAQGGTLSYEQAAMLAAMPNAPGLFSPDPANKAGYEALQARWHYVLGNMVRDGDLSQQQANAAVFPKYTPPKGGNGWSGSNGYLMQMVEQQLLAPKADGGFGLTSQEISTRGYRIVTTFSPARISALARAVNKEKAVIRQQAAYGGGVPLPGYDHVGAALIDPKTGGIEAIYGGPGYLSNQAQCIKVECQINTAEVPEQVGSSFKPYVLATAVNEGMNVFTSQLNGFAPIYIPEKPADTLATEHALSVTSPPKGATQISQYGMWVGNMFYFLFNEASENSGKPLPVNVATAISSDPAFEDLVHRDGIQATINMAQSLGVGSSPFLYPVDCGSTQNNPTYAQTLAACNDLTGKNGLIAQFSPTKSRAPTAGTPAIALGEGPLTAIEQASTFATFADGGTYHAPHVIAALSREGTAMQVSVASHQVLSKAAAADVDYALSFDNNMNGGTAMGTVTYRPGGIIAKTGTIGSGNNTNEAWFAGATPVGPGATPAGQAMAVTIYSNYPTPSEELNNLPSTPSGMRGTLGGAWPASIWNEFFSTEWPSTSYPQVTQVFPPVNGYPFTAWLQAKPKPKKLGFCKPGQTKNCKPGNCQPRFRFGQPCNGGNPTPNPNPTPTCGHGTGQPCGGPNPNPTCSFPGQQQCTTPTPTPTTPTPTCTALPCVTPSPGVATAKTTAFITVRSLASPALAAEERQALVAKLDRLLVT